MSEMTPYRYVEIERVEECKSCEHRALTRRKTRALLGRVLLLALLAREWVAAIVYLFDVADAAKNPNGPAGAAGFLLAAFGFIALLCSIGWLGDVWENTK